MKYLFIFFLSITITAEAYDPNLSHRDENIDYSEYFERAQIEIDEKFLTPLGTAKLFNENRMADTTEWPSHAYVQDRFKYLRDLRFIRWNARDRRSSWLYPDDGCFARASLMNKNIKLAADPVPGKVFVFGNLKVITPNSPRGYVTWWYHVAPVVQVAGLKYVLDPAIEASRPLPISQWLARMGNPVTLKVSLCSSGTYGPRSNCSKITDGIERSALSAQGKYLNLEWNRLIQLERDPVSELGNNPPWNFSTLSSN